MGICKKSTRAMKNISGLDGRQVTIAHRRKIRGKEGPREFVQWLEKERD